MTELHSSRSDIPDVSSVGINASTKLIWQAVQATGSFKQSAIPGKLHGAPGKYWHGSVNQVINDLWPALNDRYLTSKEQAENLKLALNRFLKRNNALVCTHDGGLTKRSLWFVAEHWPELTVTLHHNQDCKGEGESIVVTDEAASPSGKLNLTPLDVFSLTRPAAPPTETEERDQEVRTSAAQKPATDTSTHDEEDIQHECRLDGCTATFKGVHHRAIHEMHHGFRYNEDGTVTNFDPADPVPDEEAVQALIIKACRDAKPMNSAQIVEAVRKLAPRASSSTVKIVLQILTDDKWFEHVTETVPGVKGRTQRYRFLGEPVRRGQPKPTTQVADEKVSEKADDVDLAETAPTETEDNDPGSRVERYQGLFQELMSDLADLNALREALVRERKLREDAERSLVAVTKQRDDLQGKLDTLKQVFGDALQ